MLLSIITHPMSAQGVVDANTAVSQPLNLNSSLTILIGNPPNPGGKFSLITLPTHHAVE